MTGVPEPLAAIQDAVNLHGFDELMISMLPKRVSRWLHLDLPHKAAGLGLPVTTVTARARRAHPGARLSPAGQGLASGGVTPFWIWVQVAIIVCVLFSAVVAIVKLV